MEKSLIEIAKDYLETQTEAKSIVDIMDYVFSKVNILDEEELLNEKNKFYIEFTLCSDFVYCGKNTFDLKKRQNEALYDCDSSFFIDAKERKRKINARKKKAAALEEEKDAVENYDGENDEEIDELSVDDFDGEDLDLDELDDEPEDLEDDEDEEDEDDNLDSDFLDYDDDELYEK